ncbi:Cell division protein FtsB [Gallionellaceae bacterium]|nr:Cell division protein FtsB [Gallionellaceae bacterium]
MRWISLILVIIILLLQYPLWLGKGSWLKVWDLGQQVEAQKQANQQTQARNAVLDAEVRDLKQGTEAIEERARSELGMVKRDEVFFQIIGNHPPVPASSVAATTPDKR